MSNPAEHRPCLALVPGDPTGIGPEITARVLSDARLDDAARIVLVGDRRVVEMGMEDAGVSFPLQIVPSAEAVDWQSSARPMIDLGNIDPGSLTRGKGSGEAGRLVGETLKAAIDMSRTGAFDAISFAPLNKKALFDGGFRFMDEHKMFADMLGHKGAFGEMNVLDNQWMSRVTSHVSLRTALDQINPASIETAIRLANETMKRAGIAKPRIAVAALNPHGGENGLFGMEEIEMIRPTVERVAATGIDCKGPYPSDTVYLKAFAGEFDGVVAMYHDQGQIATKLKGFGKGVTVTAGLETVFTTPAHGTAYDIVGKGVATTGALEAAIRLAARLARGARQRRKAAA
jgi:4-hydroxythreonine-4-phosphate dehydrogenase